MHPKIQKKSQKALRGNLCLSRSNFKKFIEKRPPGFLFLILFFSYFSLQTATSQVAIFNSSPSAKPGEAVSLQGNFTATAKVYLLIGNTSTRQLLPCLIQSVNQLTVRIPASAEYNLYQIYLEDQNVRSPTIFINYAQGMHFDSPEVTSGGDLRIFGRNLQLRSGATRVNLIDPNGNNAGSATINTGQSDAYKLSLKLPTLQAGKAYSVVINNGMGGSKGDAKMNMTVTAIASGNDHFQLGVGWAAKLNFFNNVYNVKTDPRLATKAVGNGVANDQPALQQAIDKAYADGGGIVYLPAGTYKLTYHYFEYLGMKNRVVIQGAGKDQTIIKFGYDTDISHAAVYWPPVTTQAGLADLSIINVDETGSMFIHSSRGQGSEIFIQRVRFDMKRSDWLWLADSDKMVIANSEFTQGISTNFGYRGPIQFSGCSNFVIKNNTFNYAVDGIYLDNAHEGTFENNKVNRDGSARYPVEVTNHVLVANFAENIAIVNNQFKVVNGPAQNRNDGETIISEGGGPYRPDEETGTLSSATANTLVDDSKNWDDFIHSPVVAIVSGKGSGQWRNIVGHTNNTLNLDRAWDVTPAAGCRYAIFNWGSRNWLVQGNLMEGNRRGITIYHNATTQLAIVNNTLRNSGSIDFTPIQHDDNGQKFLPMYNNQITGNAVSNTNGSNGVFIGIHTVQHAQEKTFGTSVIGMEMRNNIITAGAPNNAAVVDADYPEGFLNYLEYHPMINYVDEQIPAILGSILENNTAINCNNAIYLNTGSFNTFICNTRLQNCSDLIQDDRFDGNNRYSAKTVFCTSSARLMNFEATKEENEVLLDWTISDNTSNTDYFEIEKNTDDTWEPLGKVFALERGDEKLSYSHADSKPTEGINTYRLKIVDLDGSFVYSPIQEVSLKSKNHLTIYPNPVVDRLYFNAEEVPQIESIRLINSNGREIDGSNKIVNGSVSTSHLGSGTYILMIKKRSGTVQSQKIVVAR